MRFQLPLALVTLTACMSNDSEVAQVASDLEQTNGAFDTADEAAQFGEDQLFADAAIEADATVVDEMTADPAIAAMNRPDVAAHDLAVVWGRLPPDPTATEARDWTGELRLSRGGMLVRRRIGFEEQTDRVLPRTRPDLIEIRSITRPFADGLVLRVFDPNPADPTPITLTYTSADASSTYSLELRQLADGPIVIDAGGGNKIVAAGRHRNDACNHGTMRGRWHKLAPHAGAYLGVVANAAGEPIGHVRGIFGERRNGDSVMFGKFIARDGKFTGVINGTFADGKFSARWLDRAGDHGVLHGVTFEGPSLRGGGFVARWEETSCGAN